MIAKAKGIFSKFIGMFGKQDRTIGRDKGLSINLQNRRAGMVLTTKTAMTRGGSEARHKRSFVYCDCDQEYRAMTKEKRSWLWGYWLNQKGLDRLKSTNYQVWMTMCLAGLFQRKLFKAFSWLARYHIENTTAEAWTNKIVKLLDVSHKLPSGKDLYVHPLTAKYDLLTALDHKVETPGEVLVKIPSLAIGESLLVDMHSYGDYESVEGW
ncbi:MAG: hypothetical protein Q8J76_10970 [Desulfobulbaceae bacterium]|nr:hypothetical protein [Desulfobulbaceae bacterium]